MTDLILHHYAASPFAEKARAILGFKQLAWRSVDIPVIMPKPELVALTGGYRKTPVLQIGSDVYCDTPLIARVLESICPEPALFHGTHASIGIAAGRWFDREFFLSAISQLFELGVVTGNVESLGGAEAAMAFAEDRRRMMGGTPVRPPRAADGRVIVEQVLQQLEGQLGAGRFLLGETVGWVDFCAYHPLWAMHRHRALVKRLDPYPNVLAWLERMRAFGHGQPSVLTASDALQIARESAARARPESELSPPDGLKIGDEVQISANDYALEPSTGRLAFVGPDEVMIERVDPRAGQLTVHFPRVGFRLKPCSG